MLDESRRVEKNAPPLPGPMRNKRKPQEGKRKKKQRLLGLVSRWRGAQWSELQI